MHLTPETVLVASPGQVSCGLGDEAAILEIRTGVYYGLNAVGAFVWNRLQAPRTFSSVCDLVLAEYDVTPERCESDLRDLIAKLAGKGLIEVRDRMPE